MNTYPLAQHFNDAAEQIKKITTSPSNDDLLILYGLYKQATVGDVNISQPSFYQFEAKAKYGAWEKQKGKSQDQAKHEYVEYAMKFLPAEVKAKYN